MLLQKSWALAENLCGGNYLQYVLIYFISAIGIEEYILVRAVLQVESKRPRASKKIDMPVRDPGVSEVDKSG